MNIILFTGIYILQPILNDVTYKCVTMFNNFFDTLY